jgi:hypothetical protein
MNFMKLIYKKLSTAFLLFSLLIFVTAQSASALFDPLSKPNNFYGMHVLFQTELGETAELVNSSGGEWGYITIPIQMGDYDLQKWQGFMDEARAKKIIPIVRLMTDPYWANTHVWRKPNMSDIIDMANFLNSLHWPIENRYVIVFNEMNRYDEWGGEIPNPEEYVDILSATTDIFKERNEDFYMIMGGLDNAAPDDGMKHMSVFTYLERMAAHNPDAFKKMDGFSSHSYPNPGFEQPPSSTQRMGTSTYKFEYEYIQQIAGSPKPVFLTETGWDSRKVSDQKIAEYYKESFEEIWGKDKDKIVAITPFLLRSHGGFDEFSFIKDSGKTPYYNTVASLSKTKGQPTLEPETNPSKQIVMSVQGISTNGTSESTMHADMSVTLKEYFKSLLGL